MVIADLEKASARAVATEIGSAGGEALAVRIDVAPPEAVDAAIAETLKHYSRLDVLVNNAGIGSCVSALDMTLTEWERNLRINLTGTFLCAQAAARASRMTHLEENLRAAEEGALPAETGGSVRSRVGPPARPEPEMQPLRASSVRVPRRGCCDRLCRAA